MDHFIPYVSPFILTNHNNKNRNNDFTFFTSQNNQSNNESDIERMRGNASNLTSSSLVQFPSGN